MNIGDRCFRFIKTITICVNIQEFMNKQFIVRTLVISPPKIVNINTTYILLLLLLLLLLLDWPPCTGGMHIVWRWCSTYLYRGQIYTRLYPLIGYFLHVVFSLPLYQSRSLSIFPPVTPLPSSLPPPPLPPPAPLLGQLPPVTTTASQLAPQDPSPVPHTGLTVIA